MRTLLLLILIAMCSQASSNPNELPPCPNKPNCVSTLGNDSHAIEPFKLTDNPSINMTTLATLVEQVDTRIIVTQDGHRIHAEISSRLFGFIDDLDLILDESQQRIHVRSASRSGYYDFCVNRKRVDNLRELLKKEGIIQ